MVFSNFFYSDQSAITHILSAGLHIDSVENYFTEQRRITYNENPNMALHKNFMKNSLVMIYHVSKPVNKLQILAICD